MTSPNARLRAARIAAGFPSARAAALHYGWTETTYRGHEVGPRAISRKAAVCYSDAYGIGLSWLLTGADELTPADRQAGACLAPVFDLRTLAGLRGHTRADLAAAAPRWLPVERGGGAMVAIGVDDMSMSPTLAAGDTAICDMTAAIEPEAIVAVLIRGDSSALFRRFGRGRRNLISLHSDNAKWGRPRAVPPSEVVIMWRVTMTQRRL